MKRIVCIFLLVVAGAVGAAARQLDSLSRAQLKENIEGYFGLLAGESLDMQTEEADKMIDILSGDSLLMRFTAETIYKYYFDSPLMGAENVAVHVFDRWFAEGPLKMEDDMDFLNAKIYADFNRQSLIGRKAPELVMEAIDGSVDSLFAPGESSGRYSVLYFYDTGCAKCRLESILLRNMFATEDFPVVFYAIYAGNDKESWKTYVSERLDVGESTAHVSHLWDPELDSDFQRKYGVLQTPRLFLVTPEGVIAGRGLDAKALSLMLHGVFDVPELRYGSDESAKLFDGIFEGSVSVEDVKRIADYIEESTRGNTTMFRQLTGDLLYWMSNRPGEAFKEGTDYLIDSKILSRPEIWKSADDSLKIIGLAQFMDGLLDKARPGTEIPRLKVPAERIKSGRTKAGKYRLDRMRGDRNIIIFYTEGCGNCDAEKAAARILSSEDRGARILMVNVDGIMNSSSQLAAALFDSFDLSTLPFIIETDKSGIIRRRYLTLR